MPTVRLTHNCCRSSCKGHIGDTLQVSQKDADDLLARRGAVLVETSEEKAAKVAAKERAAAEKNPAETATKSAAKHSEKR